MTLLALTQTAAAAVDTFRHPNIEDWRLAIDPVLEAAGEPGVGQDKVDSMVLSESELHIETSYVLRGCECSNRITLPLSILEASDPLRAAKQFRLQGAIADAKCDIKAAQDTLTLKTQTLEALEADLRSLGMPPGTATSESISRQSA